MFYHDIFQIKLSRENLYQIYVGFEEYIEAKTDQLLNLISHIAWEAMGRTSPSSNSYLGIGLVEPKFVN